MRLFLKAAFLAMLVAIAALGTWLFIAPPEMIRVAAGYSAKIVCSNVFIAGRDPDEVLKVDVQAPGHPILQLMSVSVERDAGLVHARLLGLFGGGLAVYREGLGCTSLPDGTPARLAPALVAPSAPPAAPDAPWPQGDAAPGVAEPGVAALIGDEGMAGEGMRAIVVVKNGGIVGERYAEGFGPQTPLLGWSMTKTVTAALIGTLVRDGRLDVTRRDLLPEWHADGRRDISLSDLMGMASGLSFNEDYGAVADVTRMLYLEPDMAGFAAAQPQMAAAGSAFSYSSGTTLILSRLWQQAAGGGEAALAWPHARLFAPLGMRSAVMETDEAGTYVGSSYLYATARDWARFGQFLSQDGVWNGERLVPEGFVAWMRQPVPASDGTYGQGQLSLVPPNAQGAGEAVFGVPEDTFWLLGHDGQSIAISPSRQLVVVRLGLTPSWFGYRPQALFGALAQALP